ncbi:MAG: tetratricopeptide repeat protein [bacterium]|nr:tetratricopeptide repeat protein [bacterium]
MKYIEYFEKYLIYIAIFFLALFAFPLLPASYILPRELFLASSLALLLLLFSLKIILRGTLTFSGGKFDFAVLLVALAYLVSSVFVTPNKMEAFWLPGTATFVIASALLYFLINQLNKQDKQKVVYSLFASAVVFSLLAIFSTLGLLAKIPFNFNTLGGAVPAIIFLAVTIPLAVGLLLKHNGIAEKLFLGAASIIVALGLLVSIKGILPVEGNNLSLLDIDTSWQVAIETLKTNPLLGVGPGNYLTAFRRFRPLSFNSSVLWNGSFSSSRNFYLNVITETGFAGMISLFLLLLAVYRFQVKNRSPKSISLLLFLGLAAFFPVTSFSVILLFILLALNSGSEAKIFNVNFLAQRTEDSSALSSRIPSFIVILPVIALVIAFGYFGTRYTLAEYHFKKAIDAVDKNDAQTTIKEMVLAINLNPKVDRYHSSYAQINLLIAQNLAQNPPKEGLSEEDKNAVSQLIQIAIAEGKASVTVNPLRSDNWSLLAEIYRSVMAFAEGADAFAVQTFSQAVALDPVNPSLRISLGGIYFALGRFEEAIDTFKLAVLTKPDLANSHYNLSAAYREKGEIEKAITEMNTVLTLVKADSPDYDVVKGELEALEKKRPAPEGQSANLTSPQIAPEPVIKPPLELPEEATPPAGQ